MIQIKTNTFIVKYRYENWTNNLRKYAIGKKPICNGEYCEKICLVNLHRFNKQINQLAQNSCPLFPRTQLIRITNARVARTGTNMAFFKVSVCSFKNVFTISKFI